jgi:type IV secretion system protein VirB4
MLNLAEYRKRPAQLADWLPWAGLVATGVVLNKDGSFQRSARFRGPDLDSATDTELMATTARLNNALRRLGSGWALFVEATRKPSVGYPNSTFPDALSWLVDQERRAAFELPQTQDTTFHGREHFDSTYHLTVLWLPPAEASARATQYLFESAQSSRVDWRDALQRFIDSSDRLFDLLDGVFPELVWLGDAATLTYLHSTVSTHEQAVAVPEIPFYLDTLLADSPLSGGLAPQLGDHHLRVLTVQGFPTSTWPGLLDELNRLGFSYRWSTRFLALDKHAADSELTRLRRQWFAKRKSVVALLRETLSQQESPLVDADADNKAADADAALQTLGSDAAAFGYVTATVTVLDKTAHSADEKLRAIARLIQGRGFITIAESLNAVEAWLSSIPGNVYANVRQPLLSTLNLAHLLPLSAVWAGPERNAHLDGPPLMLTSTDGVTPFRLVTHVGDVGHTLIVGPTGAGKSVLLATLLLQFRRYRDAQIFLFDKGLSARATVLGLGGRHYDLGGDAFAFQPLAAIDDETHRAWAAEWVVNLLRFEQIDSTPEIKDAVWSALESLSRVRRTLRTLTGLSALVQSNRLRLALQPYTLNGPLGRLLDAENEQLSRHPIQCFEMETLMQSKAAVWPVLSYLLHRLDAQFDGKPTLLILDEAWLFLDDAYFASRLREWLKTLRKRNVSVIFATQSLADVQRSSIAPAIVESCPTRIFLANAQALEPQLHSVYASFGLSDKQISILASATPKRDYYFQSRLGNRLFQLGLGAVALAFAAAGSPEDQRAIDELSQQPSNAFAEAWLRHRQLDWAADLLKHFDSEHSSS